MRALGALCGAVVVACMCCGVAIADTPRYPNHHAHACLPPNDTFPFCDTTLAVADRVADLISRMTLAEKVSMTYDRGSEVDSIGIPDINWCVNRGGVRGEEEKVGGNGGRPVETGEEGRSLGAISPLHLPPLGTKRVSTASARSASRSRRGQTFAAPLSLRPRLRWRLRGTVRCCSPLAMRSPRR